MSTILGPILWGTFLSSGTKYTTLQNSQFMTDSRLKRIRIVDTSEKWVVILFATCVENKLWRRQHSPNTAMLFTERLSRHALCVTKVFWVKRKWAITSGQLTLKTRPPDSQWGEATQLCWMQKSFSEARNLKRHLLTHSGEKSHTCTKCTK